MGVHLWRWHLELDLCLRHLRKPPVMPNTRQGTYTITGTIALELRNTSSNLNLLITQVRYTAHHCSRLILSQIVSIIVFADIFLMVDDQSLCINSQGVRDGPTDGQRLILKIMRSRFDSQSRQQCWFAMGFQTVRLDIAWKVALIVTEYRYFDMLSRVKFDF